MRQVRQWLADLDGDVDAPTVAALGAALDVVEAECAFRAKPGGKTHAKLVESVEAFGELVRPR